MKISTTLKELLPETQLHAYKPECFMELHGLPISDLIFENCRVSKKNLVAKQSNFKNLMQAWRWTG